MIDINNTMIVAKENGKMNMDNINAYLKIALDLGYAMMGKRDAEYAVTVISTSNSPDCFLCCNEGDVFYREKGSFGPCGARQSDYVSDFKALTLADLRKKQEPTVFDAVNNYKGDSKDFFCAEQSPKKLKEFNQCVADLEVYANSPHAVVATYNYAQHKLDYPQPKPRMNVEYVKCEFDCIWEGIKAMETGGATFFVDGNEDAQYIEIGNVPALMRPLAMKEAIYRKVETEIKTEKRWILIGNEDISRERILHSDKPRYLYEESDLESLEIKNDYQLVAINVDI